MVTAIIPALNEEKTIRQVISFCLANPLITEVIVVDDHSEDATAQQAREAGARVILSQPRGKGISMRDGIRHCTNDYVLFLDADIDPYPADTIRLLAEPLIRNEADFVKGAFARNAGRVTELVAKPLLNILFPGLVHFSQPLSGMIAGRKTFFNRIDFFNDYGVDIGILIDMYLMKARVQEVNIGYIENKSKPWEALGKMSKEVSRAIISKAQGQPAMPLSEEEVHSLETINREMNHVLQEKLSSFHRMAVFDMDDTILQGRFIDACAKRFGFSAALEDLREAESDPIILTKRIGLLLKGRTMDDLLEVAGSLEMVPDIREVVQSLKEKGYVVGIISSSYTLVTNYVRQQIGADFSLAHQLEFFEGRATGEVNLPYYFFGSPDSDCGHAFCKTNALQHACRQHHVLMKNCIAIGDSRDDRCMVGHAGKGIAFCTADALLGKVATRTIREKSFASILELA
ncbi:MAG TPA: HAD-IB family phosphatase [Chitinophagaceae bacterium]|nr:HAD-IB family phosphatase [Chitinophagaceae bacterium]